MNASRDNNPIPSKRLPTHAQDWYPRDKERLDALLNGLLTKARSHQIARKVKVIIAPHAGIMHSGSVSAHAYACVNPKWYQRVIILAPSHFTNLQGCSLTPFDTWQTPIGDLKIDQQTCEALQKTGLFQTLSRDQDEQEHSIELQSIFLQQIFKEHTVRIVPIVIGDLSQDQARYYADALLPYMQDDQTLFIVSSDFTHWGERFQYTYKQPTVDINKSIEALDNDAMRIISSFDSQRFRRYLTETANTICGRNPIILFMELVNLYRQSCASPKKECRVTCEFLAYKQSAQITELSRSSVSYASAIVVKH